MTPRGRAPCAVSLPLEIVTSGKMSSTLEKEPFPQSKLRIIESLTLISSAWVPGKIGLFLRRLLYPFCLASVGRKVFIKTGVDFIGARKIRLGHNVRLDRNVRIRCADGQVIIGDNVRVDQGAEIYCYDDKNFVISNGVKVGSYCRLSGHGALFIGENCLLGPHVSVFTSNHVFEDPSIPICQQGFTAEGIVVEADCWLGAGVKVMDGIRIGKGCVIGAGAVVTKSLPPYSIALGIPARIIKSRKKI